MKKLIFCILVTLHPASFTARAAWSNGRAAKVSLTVNSEIEQAPVRSEGICVDWASGKVYVADNAGSRVLRYSYGEATAQGAAPEAVLGQADFSATTGHTGPDKFYGASDVVVFEGSLFVADSANNRVMRFDNAASKPTGSPADGVLGQTSINEGYAKSGASGMKLPDGLAIDSAGRLYVSDFGWMPMRAAHSVTI